jgi:hypothetical protein
LLRLLRSEFSALAVGYTEGDSLYRFLPPTPAAIHGFVYCCSPEEVREFSSSFDFLSIVLNSPLPVARGEFIGACLRRMSEAYDAPHRFLVAAGKELAQLLRGNYSELRTILGRLEQ